MTNGRVLIIDDEPDLLAGLVQLFELEGLAVQVHSSLITTPFVLRSADPDVILLDLSMPALSGKAAFLNGLRCLKTDAPVILFSGRGSGELAALVEELGADGFLCKSDDAMAMIHRVRIWITNRRALASA